MTNEERPTLDVLRQGSVWYMNFEFELDEQPGLSSVSVERAGRPRIARCFLATGASMALIKAIIFVEGFSEPVLDPEVEEEDDLSEIDSLERELSEIDSELSIAQEKVRDLKSRRESVVESITLARRIRL